MKNSNLDNHKERGSLTVEAVLFLIPFMLAFLTLVNVARYAEAEMLIHHSITQTAKQVSTYSYLLTKTEVSSKIQETTSKSDKFITTTTKTIDSVTGFFDSVGSFGSGDLVSDAENVLKSGEHAQEMVTAYFSDPDAILSGVMAVVKSGVQQQMLKALVGGISRANIKTALLKVSDDPDLYLEHIGIVDGMEGLNFWKSEWIGNSEGKPNLKIVVTYKMKNLIFPMFDFGEIDCCQCASTLIW